jgi:DNA mismatch repair protein MutH
MKKCKYGEYDEKSKESIYHYATILKEKSLLDLYPEEIKNLPSEYFNNNGKGSIGKLVEKLHFGYKPNSRPEPDFAQANLELKTTPLKIVKNKLVSKERLVLGMIDYFHIDKETFESSSFLNKNTSLLLLFYLYEKGKSIEQIFKIIKLWDIPEADISIIKQDWLKIYQKIKDGKAQELSGGDTFYLEAARKGAGGLKDLTTQPNSEIKANRRAFAFKSKYVNIIIEDKGNLESVIGTEFAKSNITLEEYITEKFKPFIGQSAQEIATHFNLSYSIKKKDIVAAISKAILGVNQQNKIEEFEKADIQMKTITLENNGRLKESMSFKQIDYKKIVEEKWIKSYFYNEVVNRKFFFVIFRKDENEIKKLERVMFWNMPFEIRETAKEFWQDTKNNILKGNMNNFWKSRDNKGFHVRTKARNASDTTMLRDGNVVKKLGYWINRKTILSIISS